MCLVEEYKFWDQVNQRLNSPKGVLVKSWIQDLSFEKAWLKIKKLKDKELEFIAIQIQARHKYKSKFPTLTSESSNWVFPTGLPLEQSSSEWTAAFKAQLIQGNKLVDLTGGMGIDAYYMGKNFLETHYFELNPELIDLAKFNFQSKSFKTYLANSDEFDLETLSLSDQDWVYLDPARRVQSKKVFLLHDTQPNAIQINAQCRKLGLNMMLKTSPMLDVSLALNQLKGISNVYIVSVKNEVKELLFVSKNDTEELRIKCFELEDEPRLLAEYELSDSQFDLPKSDWKSFVYEPHPALIKANFMAKVCKDYSVHAIHSDIKLFTSDQKMEHFAGKIFKINEILKPGRFNSNEEGYHIMAKNYLDTAEKVRSKFKIKPGKGNQYLILTRDLNQKPIWISAERIK